MYKVFYNQKPIHFTSDLSKSSPITPLIFIKYAESRSIIKALKDKTVEGVYLYHHNKQKIEKHFFKIFKVVEAAGGLVKNSNGAYLFIFRNKKWDLPKGKVQKSEIINEAAIREVIEETGVKNLRIKKSLSTTYHVYKANKKFKLKKTYWFLMETSYHGNLVPQIDENIDLAIWKFPEEIPILMKNAYENIKLLINKLD